MKTIYKIAVFTLALASTSCVNDEDLTSDKESDKKENTNTTETPNNNVTAAPCTTSIPYMKEGFVAEYGIYSGANEVGSQVFENNCFDNTLVRTKTFEFKGAKSTSFEMTKIENNFIHIKENNDNFYSKIYQQNCVKGSKWQVEKPRGATSYYEVMEVDSTVTVPAGTYSCKLIRRTDTDSSLPEFYLFNEEVGLVSQKLLFYGTLKLKEVSHQVTLP